MKILVDEMPKNPTECNLCYEEHINMGDEPDEIYYKCKLSNDKTFECPIENNDSSKCPYLREFKAHAEEVVGMDRDLYRHIPVNLE